MTRGHKLTGVGVDLLLVVLVLGARDKIFARLHLKDGAGLAETVRPQGVHCALEGVALPAEEVIAVGAVSGTGQGFSLAPATLAWCRIIMSSWF